MSSKKDLILDLAEQAILAKGFSATSIDELVFEAKISKNGFFYHFKDKNDLAKALLQRYIDNENATLDVMFREGRSHTANPLEAMLYSLELLAKMMDDISNGHPGCLVATLSYSENLHNREIRELNRQALDVWRGRFFSELESILDTNQLNKDVDLNDVAEMILSIIEGGIVLSRALNEPSILGRQIRLSRYFIGLIFSSTRNI